MTTYHDGMELGDWRQGAQEAARFDIGLSKVSLQDTPLPSTWDIAKQNFVDSHRTQNIAAAAQNLNTTFDEVNDKIKAATGVSDLFNPMISEASPFMPVKMPDGKLPARPDGDLFEAWKARVRELRTTHPDALNWDEIETEPERRAYQIMKETRERTNTMSQRLGLIEPGQIPYIGNIPLVGATAALGANMMTSPIAAAAQFAGGMAGTITSPVDTAVNLFAGAAGNQAKSIVSNAMKNAYINALAQAPLSAAKQYDYEKAGLPTGWRVWLSEVEGAAAAGFLLDAGVRAPVRAARRAMGAQDLGGVFLDALPRANLAERPEGMAPIDPKVFEAAATGDLKATREILEKSGALEDPAIRGALDHMETGAKMDAVMIERLKEMGVAESEGFRILSNLLEGGYARAPDRLAADLDAMRNPPQPAIASPDLDRVVSVSRAALEQIRADLPQIVEMAVEARIPEVEAIVRTAAKDLGQKGSAPDQIAAQVAKDLQEVMADPRVADAVRLTSGGLSPPEMAAIVRRSPDLKRYLDPEIDRPRQALAIASLDDVGFGRVMAGEIAAPLAAHVADTVTPQHHAKVFDDIARERPQSLDELRQLLADLPPREAGAEPVLKSGASGIDDPAGPKAKAQLEAMKVDQAQAIENATAAIKERDKIASKVEGLQGEVAKLVDKPDISEADAMKLAKARAELAELEPQLERLKADTSPDQAGAQAMYRIAMMAYHQRREADVFRAVNHALELARKITPSDTKIEVKPELRQDGIVLDAASDIDTGNIALAIRAVDPDARMGHEALHTLVTKGLISPAEVAELAALARENGTFANEAKYREAYADRPNLERQIEEEAAASYVEAVVRGDIKQAENTIANRVKDFIERIKNLLKGYGFKTRDDIVTALLNGDMARREPVRQWMRENDISALAVRPDAGVMMAMSEPLDMSPEARKARAEAMGFDTSVEWFHGTRQQFEAFDKEFIGDNFRADERGFFFINDPKQASEYATSDSVGLPADGGSVIPSYLRMNRPLLIDDMRLKREGMQPIGKTEDVISFWDNYQALILEWADAEKADGVILVDNSYRQKTKNAGQPTMMAVVFEPNQIRSVNAAFDPRESSSPNLMFAIADRHTGQDMRRSLDALGYYSKLDEVLGSLGPKDKVTAQTLQAKGVKLAEIEARGLKDALADGKSVPVSELMETAGRNRVELRESARYKTPPADIQSRPNPDDASLTDVFVNGEQAAQIYRDGDRYVIEMEDGDKAQAATFEQAMEYVRRNDAGLTNQTEWSSYSLDPSNPTYRETVLHLPESRVDVEEMRKNVEALRARVNEPGLSFDEMLARRQEADRASSEMAAQSSRQLRAVQSDFRSGHFSEPNIIGHMMTSMTKHEGQPVYTIDQIQSDWGQKLRDGGVRDEAKIAELERLYREANAKALAMEADRLPTLTANGAEALTKQKFGDAATWATLSDEQRQEVAKLSAENATRNTELNRRMDTAGAESDRLEAEWNTARNSAPGHPLVNTTDQWTVTTLRRALRQAAEADASYIAIPHGDTVLSYNPEGTEGPEGMRKFYGTSTSNAIVPKNLRNIIQKLDKDAPSPIRVKMLETPTRGMANRGDLKISDGGSDFGFTLFPLTDKIKQEVTQRGQVMFAFAGEKARTADLDALARAKQMEAEGTDRTNIWTDTGWFRGVDGKWKWEIDDSAMTLNAPVKRGGYIGNAQSTLGAGDIVSHEKLIDAYPELANLPVRVDGGRHVGSHFWPGKDAQKSALVIADYMTYRPEWRNKTAMDPNQVFMGTNGPYTFRSTAAHELQHAVGSIDGSLPPQGLGTRVFSSWEEVEARAVQKRMDMTPEERRARPPWLDYDVPEDQQIVRFADGSGPMFAFADPPVTPGLDMSPEARKARAEQMGFDTGTVWYHGTNKDFDAFDLGQFGTNTLTQDETPAIFFTTSPKNAAGYAEGWGAQARDGANIRPVYLRSSNFDEWDLGGGALKPDLLKQAIAEAKADGRDGVIFRRALDMARQVAPGGEASRNAPDVVAVFDPKNIRSINAAFDPANADSPNLMFAMADNAQSEPPRRPIEQDYAVIDRLQKMNELIEACR